MIEWQCSQKFNVIWPRGRKMLCLEGGHVEENAADSRMTAEE
jgi:hypothetical protein